MGKSIDLTQPLSDEDRAWLEERGKFGDLRVANELARTAGSASVASPVQATTSEEEAATPSKEEPAQESDEEDASTGGLYDDWSKAQLQYELSTRSLSQNGTKVELVLRLEDDDSLAVSGEDIE